MPDEALHPERVAPGATPESGSPVLDTFGICGVDAPQEPKHLH